MERLLGIPRLQWQFLLLQQPDRPSQTGTQRYFPLQDQMGWPTALVFKTVELQSKFRDIKVRWNSPSKSNCSWHLLEPAVISLTTAYCRKMVSCDLFWTDLRTFFWNWNIFGLWIYGSSLFTPSFNAPVPLSARSCTCVPWNLQRTA